MWLFILFFWFTWKLVNIDFVHDIQTMRTNYEKLERDQLGDELYDFFHGPQFKKYAQNMERLDRRAQAKVLKKKFKKRK